MIIIFVYYCWQKNHIHNNTITQKANQRQQIQIQIFLKDQKQHSITTSANSVEQKQNQISGPEVRNTTTQPISFESTQWKELHTYTLTKSRYLHNFYTRLSLKIALHSRTNQSVENQHLHDKSIFKQITVKKHYHLQHKHKHNDLSSRHTTQRFWIEQ